MRTPRGTLHIQDAVCGAMVVRSAAMPNTTRGGLTLYFCSPACKQRFDANPDQFIPELAERPDGPAGGIDLLAGADGADGIK